LHRVENAAFTFDAQVYFQSLKLYDYVPKIRIGGVETINNKIPFTGIWVILNSCTDMSGKV